MSEIWRIDVMCFMTLHQVASVHFLPIIRSTTVSQLTSRMETSLPPTSETFVSTSDSAVSNSQRSQKTAEVSATTDGHGSTPIFSSIQVSTTADTGHSRTIHSQTSTNRHSSVSDTTALVPKTTIVSSFGMTDRAPTSRITTLYSSTIDSTNTIGKTTTPPLIVSFPTTEGGHTSRIQYQQSTSLSSSTIDSTNVIGKTTTPPLTSSFPTTDGGYTSRLNYQQSTTKYSSTTDFTATATSTSVQLSTTKNHHQTSTTPITSRTDSTSSSRISTTSPTYSTISTHNVSTMSTIKTTQCKVCSGSFCGAFPQMETNVLCSNQKPFCMNTISFSTTSQKKVEKRCASTNECETLWWKQTSDDFDLCVEMNKKRVPSSDMDCHFCCVQDGCNQPVVPVKGTFYQGH